MGKGGAGQQHIQATQLHIDDLMHRLEEQRNTEGPEAQLLLRYWWLITDSTLRRFITANNCDVGAAHSQVLSHLAWRAPYGVEDLVNEDFSDLMTMNEIFWKGFDNDNHPVLVWNAAVHDVTKVSSERYVRYFVYLLETGAQRFFGGSENPGTFVLVVNATGIGRKNIDFGTARLAAPIIETNFPERQFRTFVINPGTLITYAWRVVSTFLDPGTVFKIRLVPSMENEDIRQNFAEDQLAAIKDTFNATAARRQDPADAPPESEEELKRLVDEAEAAAAAGSGAVAEEKDHFRPTIDREMSTSDFLDTQEFRETDFEMAVGGGGGGVVLPTTQTTREGMLFKRATHLTMWNIRFCMLNQGGAPTDERPYLITRHDAESFDTQKILPLRGCSIMLGQSGAYHTIVIVTPNNKGQTVRLGRDKANSRISTKGSQQITFGSRQLDDAVAWVTALRMAVAVVDQKDPARNTKSRRRASVRVRAAIPPTIGEGPEGAAAAAEPPTDIDVSSYTTELARELALARDWQYNAMGVLAAKDRAFMELYRTHVELVACSTASLPASKQVRASTDLKKDGKKDAKRGRRGSLFGGLGGGGGEVGGGGEAAAAPGSGSPSTYVDPAAARNRAIEIRKRYERLSDPLGLGIDCEDESSEMMTASMSAYPEIAPEARQRWHKAVDKLNHMRATKNTFTAEVTEALEKSVRRSTHTLLTDLINPEYQSVVERTMAAREAAYDELLFAHAQAQFELAQGQMAQRVLGAELAATLRELDHLRTVHMKQVKLARSKDKKHESVVKKASELEKVAPPELRSTDEQDQTWRDKVDAEAALADNARLLAEREKAKATGAATPARKTWFGKSRVNTQAALPAQPKPLAGAAGGAAAAAPPPPEPVALPPPPPGVRVLNREKVWVSEARAAMDVIGDLLQQMHEVYRKAEAPDGEGEVSDEHKRASMAFEDNAAAVEDQKDAGTPGFDALHASPAYLELVLDMSELQRVKLDILSGLEPYKFFLQLFNLICMHAPILYDGVEMSDVMDPTKLANVVAYDVGGRILTVAEIEQRMNDFE